MALVEETYRIALERDQFDRVMLNQMICTAGNNGRMDLAEDAFAHALMHGQFDVKTFFAMITVANHNNNPWLAHTAYCIAEQYNQVDQPILSAFNRTLYLQENLRHAQHNQSASTMGYRRNPYSFFCATLQVVPLRYPSVIPTVAPIDDDSVRLQ